MRLLHTADWHLGRSFHGADLGPAQERMLDHLVELARDERPDLVVVAGDVFDRAYPPLDAVERYDDAVARLAGLRIPVVITSGNHDSAIRLGLHARVAESAQVHVRTRLDRIAEPVRITSSTGVDGLLVYAIPYLDPPTTAPALGATEANHTGVVRAALDRIDADRARHPGIPAMVVGHGVVAGGIPIASEGVSTAERSIDVGGVSAVPSALFDGFDYVALGHLHRPQTLGDRIRYSGAPLAFGFDEAGNRKSVSMVTLGDGAPTIEAIETPVPRQIARVRGTIEELLSSEEHAGVEDAWIEATVTDRLRPKLAMEQLRRRFPYVLKLDHHPEGRELEGRSTEDYRARVRGRSEQQIASQFLAEVRGGIDADDAERQLLVEALEAFQREEALN
ncbi:MAG: exonuclease SbcCD subunit D [Solirubrobacteraceae bacterium]|nr:exonuclease SbcCD subunit D [Solirubrobacteraceae bacterium]